MIHSAKGERGSERGSVISPKKETEDFAQYVCHLSIKIYL
jgi:hypothetical protein